MPILLFFKETVPQSFPNVAILFLFYFIYIRTCMSSFSNTWNMLSTSFLYLKRKNFHYHVNWKWINPFNLYWSQKYRNRMVYLVSKCNLLNMVKKKRSSLYYIILLNPIKCGKSFVFSNSMSIYFLVGPVSIRNTFSVF